MTASFHVGAVLHWEGFEFDDGTAKNKYFVILGAKPRHNYLVVIATSQPKSRSYQPGCHAQEGYYHIPEGGKDFFRKDTWLLLMESLVVRPSEIVKLGLDGRVRTVGTLRDQVANAIRNCLRQVEDVSQAQLELL